jgi:hypothetical protein
MCRGGAGRSVDAMISTPPAHLLRTLAIAAGAAALALALLAASPNRADAAGQGDGKGKTETLRFFSKPVSFTYTSVDGTVTHEPPAGPPQVGDVFEIDSIDFAGNHRRHAKRPTASDYLRCTFIAGGEPDCQAWVAIGGSMLRFHGFDIVGGGGRYLGATGRSVVKEVRGGSDVVVKVRVAR